MSSGAAAGEPIDSEERDRLLRDIRLPVAVAVSGGADSTALMHLVAGWASSGDRAVAVTAGVPPVLVLTVDHGLRAESAQEAAWVAHEARRLGLAHTTLRWTGPKPGTAIQETARAARYGLILDHIGREALPRPRQVLLAHHLDDQAETVLMRLARGSGLDGLSGMREVEHRTWLRLGHPVEERVVSFRRPLLAVPKRRLEATLVEAAADWLRDPSNADTRFERVRLRVATAERAALGLTTDKLALSARRLASARSAVEIAQHAFARTAVDLHAGAWAGIDAAQIAGAPSELVVRLLQTVIVAFGGEAVPPSRAQIEELAERLRTPGGVSVTLGGTVIVPARAPGQSTGKQVSLVRIYREPGRRPLPHVVLPPGEGIFWDRRFYVSLAPGFGAPVRVEPLGQDGFARLKKTYPTLGRISLPSAAAAGLPAIWAEDRLLAVACLSSYEPALAGPTIAGRPAVMATFASQLARSVFGASQDDI